MEFLLGGVDPQDVEVDVSVPAVHGDAFQDLGLEVLGDMALSGAEKHLEAHGAVNEGLGGPADRCKPQYLIFGEVGHDMSQDDELGHL